MRILEAAVLAVVQGLTEWLPISSSGHLVILQQLFKIQASVAFDVMLHLGTLLAVLVFLREDIWKILKSIFSLRLESSEARLGAYVITGSLPIAVVGLLFKSFFESLFSSLLAVGIALMLNGLILYSTRFFKPKRKLNLLDALFVGIGQAISIVPGISRSGITISAAMSRGIDRKTAYKFSFLLSVLAILGASLIKFGEINFVQEPLEVVALGVIISALVGYLALKTVAKVIISGDFHKFAYYCWLVGIVILFLSL